VKSIVDKLVSHCLINHFIEAEQEAWLRYALERRIYTFVILIPLYILAVYLSSPIVAVSFLGSFLFLKRYTNGYHAKTPRGCLVESLLVECLFLIIGYSRLNGLWIIVVAVSSSIVIFLLAPFNHPNMHLTEDEIVGLRKLSRQATCILCCGIFACFLAGFAEIAKGLTTGIAMAAFLICLAYITERRKIK